MEIIGTGIDIIECARVGKMIERHGEYFIERVFTKREIAYCQGHHRGAMERFAGRFAAKEAILKALGTGWKKGISWLDMEVVNDASGRPVVALGGGARELAIRSKVHDIQISISHCRTYATAMAIATGDAPALRGKLPEIVDG